MSNYEPTAFSSEAIKRLRGLIARYDINQAELAVLCDVSQSQFSKIIRGIRPMTLDQFAALCDALDVSVDDFVNDVTEYLANRQLHASPLIYVEDEDRLDPPLPWSGTMALDPWATAAAERLPNYALAASDDLDWQARQEAENE